MISDQRRVTNQNNGRKSRGPRTESGKSRSSRNAFRHGLSTVHRHNPVHTQAIGRTARAICEEGPSSDRFEHALIIAESEILLRFVRREQVAVIERLRDMTAVPIRRYWSTLSQARARLQETEVAYAELCRLQAKSP